VSLLNEKISSSKVLLPVCGVSLNRGIGANCEAIRSLAYRRLATMNEILSPSSYLAVRAKRTTPAGPNGGTGG